MRELFPATCHKSNHAAGLVGSGFSMLVHIHENGIVEQSAIAFGNGFKLADQVSELFDMPAADVAKDSLTLLARLARSLSIFMGIVVVARCGVSQPWEACQTLALGQHIASHACLSGGQSIG